MRKKRRHRPGRWILIGVGVSLFILFYLCGTSGLIRIISLKREEQRLTSEITVLKTRIEMALKRKERIISDPEYLRKVAEEKLVVPPEEEE